MEKILIASDHAGFKLKNYLIDKLKQKQDFLDLGAFSDESVDYPDYAKKLSKNITSDNSLRKGVLICGSGIGMSMVANRFDNIRLKIHWATAPAGSQIFVGDGAVNITCVGETTALYKGGAASLAMY